MPSRPLAVPCENFGSASNDHVGQLSPRPSPQTVNLRVRREPGAPPMKYFVAREGVAFGPYSEFQVRESVRLGIFEPTDLALAEDGREWRDLVDLLPPLPPNSSVAGTEAAKDVVAAEPPKVVSEVPVPMLASVVMRRPLNKKFVFAFAALQFVEACFFAGIVLERMSHPQPALSAGRHGNSLAIVPPTIAGPTKSDEPRVVLATPLPVPVTLETANQAPGSPTAPASPTPDQPVAMPVANPTSVAAVDTPPPSPETSPVPEREINGRIFVASSNGLNYQPSSVEVKLYPLALLKPYLEKRNSEASAKFEELKAQIKASEAEKERSRLASNAAFDAYVQSDPHAPDHHALEQASNDAKKSRETVTNEYYRLMQEREKLLSGEFYLEDLPRPAETTRTDTSGRFSFEVPQDREFAVVAGVEKELNEGSERYYWFVPVNLEGEPNKEVLLSNNNLSSQGSAESLVLTVD